MERWCCDDPQRRRDLHHPDLHLQLQRLGEWKDSAMSETKPVSARATPRPWAAQEPDEDGIAIIGLRTNNGVPYDSPTNGIVALVVMWPTEVDANDTERAKANAAFIVEAVNSHEALNNEVEGLRLWQRANLEVRDMDRAEIANLKAELASCRECRANLDCLSRGQPKDTSK